IPPAAVCNRTYRPGSDLPAERSESPAGPLARDAAADQPPHRAPARPRSLFRGSTPEPFPPARWRNAPAARGVYWNLCGSTCFCSSLHKQKLIAVEEDDAELQEAMFAGETLAECGFVRGWLAGEGQGPCPSDLGRAVIGAFALEAL